MAANDSTLQDFSVYLCARRGFAASTILGYLATIRRLTPSLGEHPKLKDIEHLIAGMRQARASYSHIKNTSQAIEAYMAFLGEPVALGRPKKPRQLLKGTLSEPEVTLLIHATQTLRERAMICLLAYSGIRNAELCALLIEDLDVAGQLVHVNQGKGAKDRTACIPGACVETMVTYIQQRNGKPGDWLFVTKRHGHRLATQDLRKWVRLLARRAGIVRRVYPHLLRHSLATNMLNRGSGILAIKQQLGHAWIQTTMIYINALPARMQAECRYFAPTYM